MSESFGIKRMLLLISAVLLAGTVAAQDSPSPSPSPSVPAQNIRISFVPPPLDGTISLGVYDAKGKLVRVLFREADINEFTIGSDALSTTWDGKDDSGENVPPGKYSAHGFVVGDVKIEGVGFFFNDWISSPEGPRFSRIRSIAMRGDNLFLAVDLVPPGAGHLLYNVAAKSLSLEDTDADTTGSPSPGAGDKPSATGRDGTRWEIERVEKGYEVKQFASTGDFLRRFPISAEEPEPKAIAASTTQDRIYLLEENESKQRIRGLSLIATKAESGEQSVSEWKVDFEKSIVAHKDFSVANEKPVAAPGGASLSENVKVKLQPNPLLNNDRVTVEMAVGFDADGSFLKSADGLPLCSISETQALRRALLILHGPNVIDVFQDDGAVVEQFRATGVDQAMGFDCGGFEVK
jgi:hypothetical protein